MGLLPTTTNFTRCSCMQAISGRVHVMNTLAEEKLPAWFTNGTRIRLPEEEACLARVRSGEGSMHACVKPLFTASMGSYSSAALWMAAWPREQLHIIQARCRNGGRDAGWDTRRQCTAPCSGSAPMHPLCAPRSLRT